MTDAEPVAAAAADPKHYQPGDMLKNIDITAVTMGGGNANKDAIQEAAQEAAQAIQDEDDEEQEDEEVKEEEELNPIEQATAVSH